LDDAKRVVSVGSGAQSFQDGIVAHAGAAVL
jgi:hypothetical protein